MEALAESPTSCHSNKIRENAKTISSPLTLPCGAILPNRLAKSAMSELLADSHQQATVGPPDALSHLCQKRSWTPCDRQRPS